MEERLQTFKDTQKKLEHFAKEIEKNPRSFVCKLHKTTKEGVRKLDQKTSWRGVARATSKGKCTNQICGWFLCIDAGAAKGSWETEK